MGRDGQEVSVLCTYDSFASQSSISLAMANTLGLLKEDLGKISIQAFGGLTEKRGTAAFVRIKELGEGFHKCLINENSQSLPIFTSPMPAEWFNRRTELGWKHRTHGGVNHIVVGKDLAGYFPKVFSTKDHMVLSRSAITGNLIISGRMKTMSGEDSSTFNNRTIVRQVDL